MPTRTPTPATLPDQPNPVDVTGLRRIFKTRHAIAEAVAGVDLHIPGATIFGLLGPNGAGKTTTLRMLSTLIAPTAGEARVAGYDLRREPSRVRTRIGYVGQHGGVDRSETARSELEFQARLYGISKAAATEKAKQLIEGFELEAIADRSAQTYSGGQRRRLDVALGLVNDPQVLFLDEPTTGLDPQSRAHLWDLVRSLRDRGTTILLTTHYLEEADMLCDRLAVMDHGVIVTEGTPDELKQQVAGDVITLRLAGDRDAALQLLAVQPFVRDQDSLNPEDDAIRIYVDQGEAAMPLLLRALEAGGFTIRAASLTRPTLDDVFLKQTGRSLREEAV